MALLVGRLIVRVLAAALCALALVPARTAGAAGPVGEHELKAAFLYQFTKFVTWPADAFATPDEPIVVGFAGRDRIGVALREMVAGRRVGERPIAIRRFESPEGMTPCHVLFVGGGEDRDSWFNRLEDVRRGGTLTVGEVDGFQERGAITLLMRENRIRLVVNLEAARAARLRISSRMLALASVVGRSEASR
jgi:hypothetical protein